MPERSPKEDFVPSSLQFSLTGLTDAEILAFLEDCDRHGVHIKWFGRAEALGFTSSHRHWRYLAEPQDLPRSETVLRGLCDLRLPSGLSEADCEVLAAVLRESMAQLAAGVAAP